MINNKNTKLRQICLISMFFLLSACKHQSSTPVQMQQLPVKASGATQVRSVAAFQCIHARGNINLTVHTGYRQPQVILRGDPRDLQQVKTVVVNGKLHLEIGKGFPRFGAIMADVRGKYLNDLNYIGQGRIFGNNLNSGLLNVYIDNGGSTTLQGNLVINQLTVKGGGSATINGVSSQMLHVQLGERAKVQLTGKANLSHLDLDGQGWFSLYWVDSDMLTIRARGDSTILLAGITKKMDVELWDKACFKGRYLRAKRAFVKTHGASIAQISSVDRQHTLASDNSDIYFYNIPEMRTDFMAFNGSVLDMREWSQFRLRDYDLYNKMIF